MPNPKPSSAPDVVADYTPLDGRDNTLPVLGVPIDCLSSAQAVQRIAQWARGHESRTVCICNVHSVVTAGQDERHLHALRSADLVTPDGAPVAWMMRRQGACGQARITGPDLMWDYCARAAASGEPIFLLGSTEDTLARLERRLLQQWPVLRIAGTLSLPFRALSVAEDQAIVDKLNASGAVTVWVSLGCPKQESWMARHRGHVQAVMVGVGAAFDFHAGTTSRAPTWMREHGLEWLHRLASDPKRLWKRYLLTNTTFMVRVLPQLLRPTTTWRADGR